MGWAGADSKAFQRLSKDLDTRPFSLSTCWRCPASHLGIARILVPHIQTRPDAPEGEVLGIGSEALASKSIPGDLIICRNNSPLISLAYAMIGNNIPCRIQGRSIGQGLINLIEMFKAISVTDLVKKLEVYRNRERQKLVEREAEQSAITALNEKLDCLLTISNNCDSVGNIIEACHNLFSDDEGGPKVILSSIHRAKGMEADNVTILAPSLLCARANDLEAWRQEKNLLYVALTRAKKILRFCGGFEGDSVESWVRGIADSCSAPGLKYRRKYDR
jgi:superfamily I DNA/RNA helicase